MQITEVTHPGIHALAIHIANMYEAKLVDVEYDGESKQITVELDGALIGRRQLTTPLAQNWWRL